VPKLTGTYFSAKGRENVSTFTTLSRGYNHTSVASENQPKMSKSDKHLYASCPMQTVNCNEESTRVHACITAEQCFKNSAVAQSDELPVARGQAEAVTPVDLSSVDEGAGVQSPVAYQSGLVRLVPLTTVKVLVNDRPLDALIDSGAQVVLINKSVLPDDVESVGNFQVQGVFGDAAEIVPVKAIAWNCLFWLN